MSYKEARSGGVHIAAAGEGSRLRAAMDVMGYPSGYPKHLLPTGKSDGETLLGRIVRQANEAPVAEAPAIYANEQNLHYIASHPNIIPAANLSVSMHANWMEIFGENVLDHRRQTLGASGDFYADFEWEEMLAVHESNKYPVTFLVAQTIPVEKGAVFGVEDDGQISSFQRKDRTEEDDFVNIGGYIFDPQKSVMKIFEDMTRKRKDAKVEEIALRMIEEGLVGAYIIDNAFNVNTHETYLALLEHTKQAEAKAA